MGEGGGRRACVGAICLFLIQSLHLTPCALAGCAAQAAEGKAAEAEGIAGGSAQVKSEPEDKDTAMPDAPSEGPHGAPTPPPPLQSLLHALV